MTLTSRDMSVFPKSWLQMNLIITFLLSFLLVSSEFTRAAETTRSRSVPAGHSPERFGFFDAAMSKIETNVDITLAQYATALAVSIDNFHYSSRQYVGLSTFNGEFIEQKLRVVVKCTRKPSGNSKNILHVVEFIVIDSLSNTPVRVWKAGIGLTTPEHAEPDHNARYLIDMPLPRLSRASLEKLMLSPMAKRAAAWYDSTVAQKNSEFAAKNASTRYTLSDAPADLPAFYDLRIPTHYEADGSWGLVVYRGSAYDEFFPGSLRETCNELKLVFATIKPTGDQGEWHEFTLMVSLMNKLDADFKLDSKRTVAVGVITEGRPISMLGSLLPQRISHTITTDLIVSPYVTGSRFRAHPQLFDAFRADEFIELAWLNKDDWHSPDLTRSKWAYGMANATGLKAFNEDILPLWNNISKEYKLIDISKQKERGIRDSLPFMLRTVLEQN